jgi:hypothetical protein
LSVSMSMCTRLEWSTCWTTTTTSPRGVASSR